MAKWSSGEVVKWPCGPRKGRVSFHAWITKNTASEYGHRCVVGAPDYVTRKEMVRLAEVFLRIAKKWRRPSPRPRGSETGGGE